MKSKIFKILGVILLIILILIILFIGRKILIISKLSNTAENTIKTTNYHEILYSYNLGNYSKEETFQLGDKRKIILTQVADNTISTTTMFANKVASNNNTVDTHLVNIYAETKEGKEAKLNESMGLSKTSLINELYTENWWELLKFSVRSSIKTTKYNGNECYYISNFRGTHSQMYVNKDTGLPIAIIDYQYKNSSMLEYVYEFDNVTENDFIEPDINEYNIQN